MPDQQVVYMVEDLEREITEVYGDLEEALRVACDSACMLEDEDFRPRILPEDHGVFRIERTDCLDVKVSRKRVK